MDCAPLSGSLPDQAPEAEHAVAFVALHFSVELVPLAMVLGDALILTLGGIEFTVTVTDCEALPPEPVQVNV